MRTRLLAAGILLGGLALLAWVEDSQALLIDDFSTDQTAIWVGPEGTVNSQVSGQGILGGERDIQITLMSAGGMVTAASGDSLSYVGISEGTALIVWDGPDDSEDVDWTGLGSIDFTESGAEDRILIPLVSNSSSAPVILRAYTDEHNYSTASVSLTGGAPPQSMLSVLFTEFAASPTGSGADFTNIGAFSLTIDGSSAPALTAVFGSVIPEPATAVLLLLGILGLVAIRRCGWAP